MKSARLITSHDPLVGKDRPVAVTRHLRWLRRVALLAVTVIVSVFVVLGAGPTTVQAAGPFVPIATVPLGLTSTFAALTPDAAFASTGATILRGDTGSTTYAFDPAGTHIGTSFTGATYGGAVTDLSTAYSNAAARVGGAALAASIAGVTVGPGLYTNVAAVGAAASTTFTMDGQGHTDAVFVFQVNGALSLGAAFKMVLINGAQAKNVFWQVNGAGTIGADSKFVGTLMANGAVSAGLNSIINGRLMTKTGAIALATNDVYSAPPSVSINGGASAYSPVSNPTISGTASVVTPVTVTIDGTPQVDRPVPTGAGAWTLNVSGLLVNGAHTVVATVTDGAGNIGTFTQILTVDTIPPVVAINGGSVAITRNLNPTISGTTDVAAGQIVDLTVTRTFPALILPRTTVVQADQTWNITLTGLTAAEWTIVARVRSPAGNTGTATQVLTIKVNAPAVAITSSALTNNPTPTITGTVETGATIALTIDGLAVTRITQGPIWSATTTIALANGTHNVFVTATDVVGNAASIAQTLTVDLIPPIVGINPGSTNSTTERTPTIVGTTDVLPPPAVIVIVRVSIDGTAPLFAAVQPTGSWNVTPFAPLALGDHTIIATVNDPAGNIATFTQTLSIVSGGGIASDVGVAFDGGLSGDVALAGGACRAASGRGTNGSVMGFALLGLYAVARMRRRRQG